MAVGGGAAGEVVGAGPCWFQGGALGFLISTSRCVAEWGDSGGEAQKLSANSTIESDSLLH